MTWRDWFAVPLYVRVEPARMVEAMEWTEREKWSVAGPVKRPDPAQVEKQRLFAERERIAERMAG